MATVADPNQDEQPGGTPGNPVNQPITGTGSAGTAQGGQTSAGASHTNANPVSPVQQNAAPQNGSGYTDVSAYLNANPTGGTSIGNQVASNLTTGYNQVTGDINNSAAATTGAINSGYIPENTQLIQQVAANPTAAVNDPTQLSGFSGQLNDTYTGPTSWADTSTNGGYGTLQGEVQNAQANANLNTPGMSNVLTQQVEQQLNPGQTSQGINALDTLLFTGDPNAVQTAQTAAAPYAGLTDYLNNQNTNIGNAVTAGQNGAAQASQDALNAFTGQTGTLTNLNNTLNTTANTDLIQAQQQQAALNADIANLYGGVAQNNTASTITGYGGSQNPWYNTQNYNVGQLSPQDLASLGMTPFQWNQLQSALQSAGTSVAENGHNFGANSGTSEVNLNNYLAEQTPTASLINPGTVATPQQYQEMAAINQLLGSQAPVQGEAINPLNAAAAGTYNPAKLDQFNYQQALSDTQALGQQQIAAAQAEAQGLTSSADQAHAASQHSHGILGAIKNDITSPGKLLTAIANPMSAGQNIDNTLRGKDINPGATSIPLAQTLAPIAGAIVGGILGNGPGALAGYGAGQALGKPLQNSPDLAHGGEVKDIEEYLNKRK